MYKGTKQSYVEWGFLGLIVSLCLVLTVLQYRWTGEFSRAEAARIRSSLREQTQNLARAFDTDLRESLSRLMPGAPEILDQGRDEAHRQRYQDWLRADLQHETLRRITVAVPNKDHLDLYEIDHQGTLHPIAWPPDWADLRARLETRLAGEPARGTMVDPNSPLMEFPIFAPPSNDDRTELEWMIFELNQDYIFNTRLPQLERAYLNPTGEASFEVVIRHGAPPGDVIYHSPASLTDFEAPPDAAANMFDVDPTRRGQLRQGRRGGGPPRDGPPEDGPPGPGRRRGRFDDGPDAQSGRWRILVRHKAGSVDAAVTRARWQNLGITFILLAMLGGAGFALIQYTRKSRNLSEMQLRFVAGVSHELRTPLTVIRGAAHNILSGVVQDRTAIDRYAKVIFQHSESLTEMIEQILAYAGRKSKNTIRVPVPVRTAIESSLEAISAEITSSGCKVAIDIPGKIHPMLGDPIALRRVFQNLLSNAAKHGRSGGFIGVTASMPDSATVAVTIRDNGPGIPESELPHLFEAFYRGDRARNDHIRGTGLGLSVLKEIVDAHHGTVTVTSAPGQGAEFTVRIPAVKEEDLDEFNDTAG